MDDRYHWSVTEFSNGSTRVPGPAGDPVGGQKYRDRGISSVCLRVIPPMGRRSCELPTRRSRVAASRYHSPHGPADGTGSYNPESLVLAPSLHHDLRDTGVFGVCRTGGFVDFPDRGEWI